VPDGETPSQAASTSPRKGTQSNSDTVIPAVQARPDATADRPAVSGPAVRGERGLAQGYSPINGKGLTEIARWPTLHGSGYL
jgi:hypothetical protein